MNASDSIPTNTTRRGTPCARSWNDAWIARVDAREEELGRRICGARTIGHLPCPGASDHPSGRCGHHGGFDLTGGQPGNRNAAVHMLYARRLMPCGSHCPNWSSCPLGGGAPDQGTELLERREADRPTCPFEQAEYNAVVTDTMRRTQYVHQNAWGMHIAHQIALLTVLVSRAAKSMSTRSFTEDVEVSHGESRANQSRANQSRLSAGFTAYEKLSRELRRWTMLLESQYQLNRCDMQTVKHHLRRQSTDTLTDPDAILATAMGTGLGLDPPDPFGFDGPQPGENPYDPMDGSAAEHLDPGFSYPCLPGAAELPFADIPAASDLPDFPVLPNFQRPPGLPDLPKFPLPPGVPLPPFPWYVRTPESAGQDTDAKPNENGVHRTSSLRGA